LAVLLAAAQSWLLPGSPSASAAAAANNMCPRAEPCTRSGLQVSASRIDGAEYRSTSRKPYFCAAAMIAALMCSIRLPSSRPTGRIWVMSGNVVVTTVAPESASAE